MIANTPSSSIPSFGFHQNDQVFFNENFEIMDKSPGVNSLDDADVILLGDRHTVKAHQTKNLWLIHKLAAAGDTVFNEALPKRNADSVRFGFPSRVYFHGWDSLAERKQNDDREVLVCKGLSTLEDVSSSDIEQMKKAIRVANALIPLSSIEAAKQMGMGITDFKRPLDLKKRCDDWAEKAEKIQTVSQMKTLFKNFVRDTTDFWMEWLLTSADLSFYMRNVSLYKNILSEANGKVFVTAGQLHLHCPQNTLSKRKAVEELKENLNKNQKKYIILFPNEKEDIAHAENFLQQQRPGLLTRVFQIFKSDILLSLSAFLYATSFYLPNKYILGARNLSGILWSMQLLYDWTLKSDHETFKSDHETLRDIFGRHKALRSKWEIGG